MSIVSHLHQLFNAETCQSYIHALRWKGSCTCSLRLIQQPDKPGKMPSLHPVYEGVLPWYRICSSTSSR